MSRYQGDDEGRSRGTIPEKARSSSPTEKKKSSAPSGAGKKRPPAAKGGGAGKAAPKPSGKGGASRAGASAKKTAPKKSTPPKAERDQRATAGASRRGKQLSEMDKRRRSDEERALYQSDEAKEIALRRRQRTFNRSHKRNAVIFYVSLSIAAITVLTVMSLTVLFNIKNITVVREGELPYTEAQIIECSAIKEGQNLFITSRENSAANVVEALPYVDICNVERKLPSTIVIRVRAVDIAGVLTTPAGQRAVISSGGRVLELVSGDREINAPELHGLQVNSVQPGEVAEIANAQALVWIRTINDGFNKAGLTLDSITIEENGAVSAMYDGRIGMIFGQPIEMEKKVQLAVHLIADGEITSNESGDINLTKVSEAIFTPDYVKEQKEERKAQEAQNSEAP